MGETAVIKVNRRLQEGQMLGLREKLPQYGRLLLRLIIAGQVIFGSQPPGLQAQPGQLGVCRVV